MRLTAEEVASIKAAAAQAFGKDAVVRLFGSRLDDTRRGGDIDLHVELPRTEPDEYCRSQFLTLLHDRIGEREIDVLYSRRTKADLSRIERKALSEGVVL